MRAEEDLTSRAREYDGVQVAVGHVGWDSGEHFDRGNLDGADGERHTLVYVTLGGKNASELKGPDRGRQIICALNALNGLRIPPKGARVYVAVPKGMEESPGAGCIIASVEDDHRDNLVNGEAVSSAADGAARSIIKNDGSHSLLTTDDNTPDGKVVALTLSPTALKFTSPWGSLTFDASGLHIKTKAGPRLDMGGISIPGLPGALSGPLSAYFTVAAPMVKLAGGSVFLGAGSIFNPVLHSPIAVTTPPAFVAPGGAYQTQTVWAAP